jgi:hypothetical protein
MAYAQPSTCCSDNLNNPGFESTASNNLRFPDSNSPVNARYSDPDNWTYDDGSNFWESYHIEDPTRASEGAKFVYLDYNQATAPEFNYCVGNSVRRNDGTSCQEDRFFNGYRYILQFDFVPFNINFPNAGPGSGTARPHIEHLFPNTLDLYLANGQLATAQNYPSVAWQNVASSWRTASGVTPAYNTASNITIWFSHDRNDDSGMLIDNTNFEMVSIANSELTSINYNIGRTQVTFNINPVSNVPVGVPNIVYNVSAPAGYNISPTSGTYNTNTSFTLTKTNGGVLLPSETVTLELEDAVNDVCTAEAILPSSAILPVTLTSFNAYSVECQTTVSWTAEDIVEFSHFEIEGSRDGREFLILEKVRPSGDTRSDAYEEVLDISDDFKYFRLKMVDLDGAINFSDIRNVRSDCSNIGDFTIFPNPVFNGESLQISLNDKMQSARVLVTDLSGRMMLAEQLSSTDHFEKHQLDLSKLAAGHYTISIQSGDDFESKKLVIID